MRVVPFRIPKQVVLPGLVVRVRLTEPGTPDEFGSVLGESQADWEDRTAVIRIDRTLPIEEQRYSLLHELHHVIVDYLHCAMKFHPKIVRVG